MEYKLLITEKAEKDLDDILSYIMTELCNAPAAAKLADELAAQYVLLAENLRLYPECSQPLLQRSHFRKAVIGSYLMIYRVNDDAGTVYIERFFSSLQDYADKL